jgi:2-phosphoglycerate kinase
MANPTVYLIGGAPGAGKTTLGQALATLLKATSLTADDLFTAAKAVTTPDSHPGLHVMSAVNSVEYFTLSSLDQLIADATAQHEATWPAIEKVIRKHAAWGPPIVIDGWFLRPKRVKALNLDGVVSFWLVADPAVLEERERRNAEFFGQSTNPAQMLQNFLGRSLWYNELIREQATALGLPILHQDGHASVDSLCAIAMKQYPMGADR